MPNQTMKSGTSARKGTVRSIWSSASNSSSPSFDRTRDRAEDQPEDDPHRGRRRARGSARSQRSMARARARSSSCRHRPHRRAVGRRGGSKDRSIPHRRWSRRWPKLLRGSVVRPRGARRTGAQRKTPSGRATTGWTSGDRDRRARAGRSARSFRCFLRRRDVVIALVEYRRDIELLADLALFRKRSASAWCLAITPASIGVCEGERSMIFSATYPRHYIASRARGGILDMFCAASAAALRRARRDRRSLSPWQGRRARVSDATR